MSRTIRTTRASLFALAVCGALGFGASASLAAPPRCPLTTIGKCTSQEQCVRNCASFNVPPGSGTCTNGCCYCPF